MDNILLIVSDPSLRRLYHELLISINIEVVPTDSIENAMTTLVLQNFSAAIIYADQGNMILVETFLHIRKKHNSLKNVKIVIITTDEEIYSSCIETYDLIINPNLLTCSDIAFAIKNLLCKK